MAATPSLAFRATLPDKTVADHDIDGAFVNIVAFDVAVKIQRPGLPGRAQRSPVRLMVSLPLMASSPILSKPTLGSAHPGCRADTKAAPMTANCSKCSGWQSTWPPKSKTVVAPPFSWAFGWQSLGDQCPRMVFRR